MNEDARLIVAASIDSGLTFAGTTRQDDKVYHPSGIAPAIAVCRTNHVPLIMEIMKGYDYERRCEDSADWPRLEQT